MKYSTSWIFVLFQTRSKIIEKKIYQPFRRNLSKKQE